MEVRPYLCPGCVTNRTQFELVYHLVQEVHKDAVDGHVTFAGDEMQPLEKNGRPFLEVRCLVCNFQGHEGLFIRAAQRSAPPGLRPLA